MTAGDEKDTGEANGNDGANALTDVIRSSSDQPGTDAEKSLNSIHKEWKRHVGWLAHVWTGTGITTLVLLFISGRPQVANLATAVLAAAMLWGAIAQFRLSHFLSLGVRKYGSTRNALTILPRPFRSIILQRAKTPSEAFAALRFWRNWMLIGLLTLVPGLVSLLDGTARGWDEESVTSARDYVAVAAILYGLPLVAASFSTLRKKKKKELGSTPSTTSVRNTSIRRG